MKPRFLPGLLRPLLALFVFVTPVARLSWRDERDEREMRDEPRLGLRGTMRTVRPKLIPWAPPVKADLRGGNSAFLR